MFVNMRCRVYSLYTPCRLIKHESGPVGASLASFWAQGSLVGTLANPFLKCWAQVDFLGTPSWAEVDSWQAVGRGGFTWNPSWAKRGIVEADWFLQCFYDGGDVATL